MKQMKGVFTQSFRALKENFPKSICLCCMELSMAFCAVIVGVLVSLLWNDIAGIFGALVIWVLLGAPLSVGAKRLYWLQDARGRFWEMQQLFFYFSSWHRYFRLLRQELYQLICWIGLMLFCFGPALSLLSGLLPLGREGFGQPFYEVLLVVETLLLLAGLLVFFWLGSKLFLVPYLFFERPGHSYLQLFGLSSRIMKGHARHWILLLGVHLAGVLSCILIVPVLLVPPYLRLCSREAARQWVQQWLKQEKAARESNESSGEEGVFGV